MKIFDKIFEYLKINEPFEKDIKSIDEYKFLKLMMKIWKD